MKSRLVVLAFLPALLLAGCASPSPSAAPPSAGGTVAPPTATSTPVATTTPTSTPPPPPPPPSGPTTISAAPYLVSSGEYAFYTDATKRVWCEIDVEAGSNPEGGCWITSHAYNALVSFTAPASIKAECGSIGGYGTQIGGAAGLPNEVNWWGCYGFANVVDPTIAAKTKVIPNNSLITVAPITGVVVGGVVKFTQAGKVGASLTFGMTVATLVQ